MAQGYLSTSLGWARACRHTWATGSLAAETEKLQRFPLKWPRLLRTQHGNLISSHFFSTPHHFETFLQVTFGAEAWSHINIRGITRQRDTQDLAAEEQIHSLKPWMYPDRFFSSCVPSIWPVSTICSILLNCCSVVLRSSYMHSVDWQQYAQICALNPCAITANMSRRRGCDAENSVLYSEVRSIYHPSHYILSMFFSPCKYNMITSRGPY